MATKKELEATVARLEALLMASLNTEVVPAVVTPEEPTVVKTPPSDVIVKGVIQLMIAYGRNNPRYQNRQYPTLGLFAKSLDDTQASLGVSKVVLATTLKMMLAEGKVWTGNGRSLRWSKKGIKDSGHVGDKYTAKMTAKVAVADANVNIDKWLAR